MKTKTTPKYFKTKNTVKHFFIELNKIDSQFSSIQF